MSLQSAGSSSFFARRLLRPVLASSGLVPLRWLETWATLFEALVDGEALRSSSLSDPAMLDRHTFREQSLSICKVIVDVHQQSMGIIASRGTRGTPLTPDVGLIWLALIRYGSSGSMLAFAFRLGHSTVSVSASKGTITPSVFADHASSTPYQDTYRLSAVQNSQGEG